MQDRTPFSSVAARALLTLAVTVTVLVLPRPARAQYTAPPLTGLAIGERYHVEVTGTLWNPTLVGTISSEEFGLPGTDLDFLTDLGFEQTRFKDIRFIIRPARKHRLRIQYTPISYTAGSTLEHDIVFRGQKFVAKIPIAATFAWKVARFGYEYDVVYRDRGFVGVFLEGRYTQFEASIAAPIIGLLEFTAAKAPLPALGIVGRGYITPNVALNFELSGFKVPETIDPQYQANYFDWDIHGTVNLTNNVGVLVGWRRMTTFLNIEQDRGDFKFQGIWFGAALRY